MSASARMNKNPIPTDGPLLREDFRKNRTTQVIDWMAPGRGICPHFSPLKSQRKCGHPELSAPASPIKDLTSKAISVDFIPRSCKVDRSRAHFVALDQSRKPDLSSDSRIEQNALRMTIRF
jgi:hypothetical protein